MPVKRVSTRRVREILRMKFEYGSSDRAIAVASARAAQHRAAVPEPICRSGAELAAASDVVRTRP
jgi:hypothetical protein